MTCKFCKSNSRPNARMKKSSYNKHITSKCHINSVKVYYYYYDIDDNPILNIDYDSSKKIFNNNYKFLKKTHLPLDRKDMTIKW